MSNLTHIYENKNGKIKLLDSLNYTLEEFENNPIGCYPNWDKETMTASEIKYEHPTLDTETQGLREKTREERILEGEVELLQDGEYLDNGNIVSVPAPKELFKKVWDKEKHTWKEGATDEEIKDFYFSQINKFKADILETGYLYIDRNQKSHQQKCRDKDLSLLGNAIAAGEDAAMYSKKMDIVWSFNDGDVIPMALEDLKLLRIHGAVFVQAVFSIETELKASEPNILLEKQDFINKINELSEVKCYE